MSILFLCDGEIMEQIHTNMEEVQNLLSEACADAEKIHGAIAGKTAWTGKTQIVMRDYMDLLLQYHRELSSPDSPVAAANQTLGELQVNLENFYEGWSEHTGLEGMDYGV